MSRRKKDTDMKINNSLTELSRNLAAQYGKGTGGSVLSSYGTQAFTNNYSLVTLNRIILTYMFTTNGIFQTAVQLPIQDALGKGFEIESGELESGDIDKIFEFWEEKDIWNILLSAWTWVRLYGGGAVLANCNQDPEQPLDLRTLEGQPIDFYDIDRWQLDTNMNLFYDWESYVMESQNEKIYLNGQPIHESRFLRGSGKRAPHYIRRQLRGWGMSEAERMLRDLNLYVKTQDVLFEILDESKIDVYKIQGLAQKLATAGGTAGTLTRIQAANEIKNYVNALVLDMNEEYEQKQMTFSGLAEVMNENRIGVAAALRMPMTKLFGLSASGFNTGESDLENYNQMVESEIRRPITPIVRQLVRITMAHLFGYVPHFRIKWPSLRDLSAAEQEQINVSKSNNILAWYDRSLLTSEEAMQEAKRAGLFDVETKAEEGLLDEHPESTVDPETIRINNSGYKVLRKVASGEPAEIGKASRRLTRQILRRYPDEVKAGTEVEREHTDDEETARKIAIDHIAEDPKYYEKIKELGL